MNLAQLLLNQTSLNPNGLAVRDMNKDLTYREFTDQVLRACTVLDSLGVQADEVVAIEMADPVDHLVATLALAYLGAISVSFSVSMPNGYVSTVMKLTGCSRVISKNSPRQISRAWTKPVIAWEEVVQGEITFTRGPESRTQGDIWTYVIGSGSTGRRKILPVSHGVQVARALKGGEWLPYDNSDVIHSTVPMAYYATKQRFFEAMAIGAAMHFGFLSTPEYISEIRSKRITVLYGTVFHFENILRSLSIKDEGVFSQVRALIIGGSHVSSDLRKRISESLSPNLFVVWGTNESHTSTITQLNLGDTHAETVGYPIPGVRLELVSDKGFQVPRGERGRIRVSSDSCIDRYLNDEELTRIAFRDGWFYTGDVGYLTGDGELVHLGRSDDMMIINGINLFPAEVERCLRSFPGIADAVVVPIGHRLSQDLPVALIVASPMARVEKGEVLSFVHSSIGNYALFDLRVVNAIPRNDQGKLTHESIRKVVSQLWKS